MKREMTKAQAESILVRAIVDSGVTPAPGSLGAEMLERAGVAPRGATRIHDLLAQASPAPWRPCAHVAGTDDDCPCDYAGDVWDATGEKVVFFLGPVDPHGMLPPTVSDEDRPTGYANGMLVCVMRETFPELLGALEHLSEAVLDRPFADPDDDAAKAARKAKRALERMEMLMEGWRDRVA